ncbi:DnaD domain protein [Enterococcus faecium]|uniref:DnaD domain-containing protein n=1 Tax=Enterococcus faecium TaxID=1352 RepID=UPI001572451F|nr:DnaD domain protein [Enterococcus faecium]EGP5718283.1 DNA replication protein DnaD [Enterococcus faecium]EME3549619.1 DnaD domain protein [Enterococcus faecium]MBK5082368.1 DnaD domain protein [Enterococcus faecium]MBK5170467.1 DnaD domain protein [Enterococcus faecium]NTJ90882.1 DnaD domain protein [Enterococcus faecium]
MDYIGQLNAFDNWLEYNELGAGPQLLWYKLMAIAKKSGWQSELSIANTRLQAMTKTSEKTLINNRNQLIQNGLLQYKKRGRTKAGVYILSDLTGNFTVKTTVDNTVENSATGNIPVDSKVNPKVNREVNPSVDSTVIPSVYINNTKQNKTNKEDDIGVYEFIQKNWGKAPTGLLQGALGPMIKTWGADMILFAFKLAFENNVEMPGLKKYVEAILNSWSNQGIKTMESAEKAQEAFKNKKKQNYLPKRQNNVRREKLPDWVDKQQEEKALDSNEKAEIDRRFEEYLKRKKEIPNLSGGGALEY